MKLRGEIHQLQHEGDTVLVTVGNVRRKRAGGCFPYNPAVGLRVPISSAKHYAIGRGVKLSITIE